MPSDSAALALLPPESSRLCTIASRSSASSGLSTRRLTVQHSGGRSPGSMEPTRLRATMPRITCQSCSMLPGQVDRMSNCIASAEQVSLPCWLSLPMKNRTSSGRSSTWWRSGGRATVRGKDRSISVRLAEAAPPRVLVTATRWISCRPAARASWSVLARKCACRAVSRSVYLIIRHTDRLTARQAHFLASTLQEARAAGRQEIQRVAVTRTLGGAASANLTEMLRSFPRTVALPPLRHHVEDLPELVRFFMGKLSQHGRLTCSAEAMQLLIRSTWPGNIEQLWQVMRGIVARKRVGSIEPGDLPPECWTVSRRVLSPLEALERDEIVQSLLDSGGNKARAAESLGMSRATIYRKIHGYGIVIPARCPAPAPLHSRCTAHPPSCAAAPAIGLIAKRSFRMMCP